MRTLILMLLLVLSSSFCKQNRNGYVRIGASWNNTYLNCNPAYSCVIGLGYSSTDVANEAYFYSVNGGGLTKTLPVGTYYYKATKTYNLSSCGCGRPPCPKPVSKSGSFTITADQTTNVSFQLL